MSEPEFDLVIYHGGCPDGITGAWVVWNKWFNHITDWDKIKTMFKGMKHTDTPPDVSGKKVVIIDFSFKRHILEQMIKDAKCLVVLDHHKSAQRDLEGLDNCIFDMTRSGAQISWDYFNPDTERPWFVDYVADRDLWTWKLPYSKAVSQVLFIDGWYKFERLEEIYTQKLPCEKFATTGQAYLDYEQKMVEKLYHKSEVVEWVVDGKTKIVRIINTPVFISETGSYIATKDPECDFVVLWSYVFETDENWISLRCVKDNVDLSKISALFGGGGHPRASGFTYRGNIRDLFKPQPSIWGTISIYIFSFFK